MAVDVTTERTNGQPIDVVSADAADPSNACEWYVNIKSVEWITTPPLTIGSRVAFVAKFLERRLIYTYEITDFVPGERLVMQTAQGPFPMETTYTWTAIDAGTTKMTLRNSGQPAGFSKLLAPSMARPCGGRTAKISRPFAWSSNPGDPRRPERGHGYVPIALLPGVHSAPDPAVRARGPDSFLVS